MMRCKEVAGGNASKRKRNSLIYLALDESYYAFRELFAHVKGYVYQARKPAHVLEGVCASSC